MKKISKETKALLFLVLSLTLLEFGNLLLTPSYWIFGWVMGALGIILFGFGAYLSMDSIIKGIKVIKQTFIK
jgi:predicted Na+-dependent transporter